MSYKIKIPIIYSVLFWVVYLICFDTTTTKLSDIAPIFWSPLFVYGIILCVIEWIKSNIPIEERPKAEPIEIISKVDNNNMKKNDMFWKAIALALVVVLYLFALNGRYEIGTVIYDKWKQRSMYFYCRTEYEWHDWTEDLRVD